MPLSRATGFAGFNWFSLVAGIFGAAFVHLAYTFFVAGIQTAGAYQRLTQNGAQNQMRILPPATPEGALLPFQSPDFRYAVCPFDISSGPLLVDVTLLDRHWTLSVHTKLGDTFYSQPGNSERAQTNHLVLLPPGDRLYSASASERAITMDAARINAPSLQGMVIVHAPVKSGAFAYAVEKTLKEAKCALAPS